MHPHGSATYRIPVEHHAPARGALTFFHHEADDAPIARVHGDPVHHAALNGSVHIYELPATLAHAWTRVPVADEREAATHVPVADQHLQLSVQTAPGYGVQPVGIGLQQALIRPSAAGPDLVFAIEAAVPLPAGQAIPHILQVEAPPSANAYRSGVTARCEAVLDTKAYGPGTYLLYPSSHSVLSVDVDAHHTIVGGHLQLLEAASGGHGVQAFSVGNLLVGESLATLSSNSTAILAVMRRRLDQAELALANKTQAGADLAKEHLEAAERAATRYKKNAKKHEALRKSLQTADQKRTRRQKLLDKIRRIKRVVPGRSRPKLDASEYEVLAKRLKTVRKQHKALLKTLKGETKATEKAATAAEKAATKAAKDKETAAKAAEKATAKEVKDKARTEKAETKAAAQAAKDKARAEKQAKAAEKQAAKDAARQAEAERKAREEARKGTREGLKEAARERRADLELAKEQAAAAKKAAADQRKLTALEGETARETARQQARAPTPATAAAAEEEEEEEEEEETVTAAEAAEATAQTPLRETDLRDLEDGVLDLTLAESDDEEVLEKVKLARDAGALLRVNALHVGRLSK